MMPAMAFARLLQLADVGARDLVLVVGAGTGYGHAGVPEDRPVTSWKPARKAASKDGTMTDVGGS